MDGKAPPGRKGRTLMENRLRSYLFWKGKLGKQGKDSDVRAKDLGTSGRPSTSTAGSAPESGVSEALRRKDARNKERQGNRRRVRGGAPATGTRTGSGTERASDPGMRSGAMGGEGVLNEEADELALL
jgi:DNA excision repair protein ERCC-4